MRIPRLLAATSALFLISACGDPETAANPAPSATIGNAVAATPAAAVSPPPSASSTPEPAQYTKVRLRVTDNISTYSDDALDGDDCTPFRLRKGTEATLLDDRGRKVATSKAGKGQGLDDEGSCGAAFTFGSFSSISKTFTLKIEGYTFTYDADDLLEDELVSLPDTWTEDEIAYLKASDDSSENKEEEGWALAAGYVACHDLLDYDDRRAQVEHLIAKGGIALGLSKAAASTLCPKAEGLVDDASRGVDDGQYDVGVEIEPGTYRSPRQTSHCSWSRTSAGGVTVAHDFVTYADAGVIVTIKSSDGGFTSKGCDAWARLH